MILINIYNSRTISATEFLHLVCFRNNCMKKGNDNVLAAIYITPMKARKSRTPEP